MSSLSAYLLSYYPNFYPKSNQSSSKFVQPINQTILIKNIIIILVLVNEI